jgi:hypothetical protein
VRVAPPGRLQFLGLAGLGPQQIGAHASAAPQTGRPAITERRARCSPPRARRGRAPGA